ncbi:MAG TPA: ATP-dependent Clp protease proteolytic subunit [Kineosporiaceae bacterium]|nr:ATP-dependent Clp protease proteolytic subunit [Kineosporiaceae bacterium]
MSDETSNGSLFEGQIYDRLLAERIVFLRGEVSDASANAVCAQLLLLSAADPGRDVRLYINSPGGSVTAGMAVYDTMQFVPNDVVTVAVGFAASMGQFLLSAGTPGKRFALPHARVMMHQPSGGIGGTATDIRIQAENIKHVKHTIQELTAAQTGHTVEEIERDADRDRWFTADQAVAYGLVDQVIQRADEVPAAARSSRSGLS